MNVLGLDLAQRVGYAVGANGTIAVCGAKDVGKLASQLRCANATALYSWLRDVVDEHRIAAICWEDSETALKGASRTRPNLLQALLRHAGYTAVARLAAETRGILVIDPVPNMTLKKFATGDGRAEKTAMIRWARKTYGLDLRDDEGDAADAAHVCAWAMQRLRAA